MSDTRITAVPEEPLQDWYMQFDQMQSEWDGNQQREIDRWNEAFAGFREDQQRLRASGQWVSGPSDLLSIVGRSRRETFHCALLAWLLDPGAPHGLQTRFLEAVLNACFPGEKFPRDELHGATTACEVVRPHSRADIVVWCSAVNLVFEAKVDADERTRQCDRLYEDFCDDDNTRFIFLTPRGVEPRTATGEAEAAFKTLGFRTVCSLLSRICDDGPAVESVSGWTTVQNYLQTLRKEFP